MDHFRRIVDDDDDDDNNKDEEDQTSRSRSDFNPPSIIRDHSAFSKPILPSSSSLLSPKPHHHFNYATTTTTTNNNHNGSSLLGSGSSPITPDPDPPTRYRDCHRNHAASLGGHVTDGCGEFMPAGPADQLKCAACGCHRSFHLKEIYSEPIKSPSPYRVPLLLPPPPPPNNNNNNNNNSHNITNQSNTQQLRSSPNPVRLSDQSSSEERNTNQKRSCHNNYCSSDERGQQVSSELGRKKRFRTKFSPEQKEKMRVFAERVGWRVQKKDEGEMERFCGEVGVSRQVLKVWMHNNKHLLKSSRLEGMQFQGRSEKVEGHDDEEEEGGQGGGERGVL